MVSKRCINCFKISYNRSSGNRDPIVPKYGLKLQSMWKSLKPLLSSFILLVHLGNGPFEAEAKLLPGLQQEQSPADFVIILPYNPLMMCQWHIGPTLNRLTAVCQWLTLIFQTDICVMITFVIKILQFSGWLNQWPKFYFLSGKLWPKSNCPEGRPGNWPFWAGRRILLVLL